MKKFFAVTMAAACALTFAAVGLSACGSDPEKMSEEEWNAAFDLANFYNVTIAASDVQTETDSEGNYETYEENLTMKLALTDNGTYAAGNTYLYTEIEEYGKDETGEYYTGMERARMYEVLTSTSYSSVQYADYSVDENMTQWDGNWYGSKSDSATTLAGTYAIGYMDLDDMLAVYSYYYSLLSYDGSVYSYSATMDSTSGTFEMTFEDGKISKITNTSSWTYDGITYSSTMTFSFSDYGSTTVSVPTEYTYAYYLENNAG